MTTAATRRRMTTEEMLALPENGVDRELINGELREYEMTKRNRRHSRTTIQSGQILVSWLGTQPLPRGEIVGGEAGFRLRRDPDFTVGIDLAYISAQVAAANPDGASIIEGVPILAVEILSPSDKHEDIRDKVQAYLDCGVALVWILDPDFQTVTIYRQGAEPVMLNRLQELDGEPHLPGFRVKVADLFVLPQ